MAIRKVSDLERLYLREEFESDNVDQISNMLFEVSWPDAIGSKSFISKHMTYHDIVENILVDNLLCSETFVDFYSPITFHNGISVYNSAWISGDFFVNRDVEDDILQRFQTLIRNGKNTIQSIGDGGYGIGVTMLCSEYGNVLSAGYENVLCAQQNIIQGNKNIICSDTQVLASFDDDLILLSSSDGSLKLDFDEVSCKVDGSFNVIGTLSSIGNAYFTNVINGCALCAKWADLAEHYASDADYAPGTLVQFGGDKEITVATTRANAVITTSPGLILNGHSGKNFKAIALVGRTPVRVVGEVKKFDRLTLSDVPGVARSCTSDSEIALGVALEANSNQEEKLVLAAVQMSV